MGPKVNRAAILTLHNQGKSNPQISKLLRIPRMTVFRVIRHFQNEGTLEDKEKSGRPRTATGKKMVKVVRERIRRKNRRSMRQMAKDLHISERSIRRIVHDRLKCASYKYRKGQMLSEKAKECRVKKCKEMLRYCSGDTVNRVLFTDEKVFNLDEKLNSQNHRQILRKGSYRSPKLKTADRSHFPSSVMVWGGICATGKTPLVFVEKGVKINAKVYQETILKDVLEPWASEFFRGADWCLQQDWAPAHGAKSTLRLCEELFPRFWNKDVWPSNSPDLNPLDYSVWGILEEKVSASKPKIIDALKDCLLKAGDKLPNSLLACIVKQFRRRLNACIKAKGDHFENLL